MNKIKEQTMNNNIAGFCKKLYLCRWDKALFNLSVTFAVMTYTSKLLTHHGVLISSSVPNSDLIVGAMVCFLLLVIGSACKTISIEES